MYYSPVVLHKDPARRRASLGSDLEDVLFMMPNATKVYIIFQKDVDTKNELVLNACFDESSTMAYLRKIISENYPNEHYGLVNTTLGDLFSEKVRCAFSNRLLDSQELNQAINYLKLKFIN